MSKSLRYPFCPFKSWSINEQEDRLILKNSTPEELQKIFSYPEINIVCNGGLWESLLSLSIFEYCKYHRYSCKLNAYIPEAHRDLLYINGLDSKYQDKYINCDLYPCPLFTLDSNPYFNTSYNLDGWYDIYGNKLRDQYKTSFNVIKDNFPFEWKQEYFPQLRNIDNNELSGWAKQYKVMLNQPYALIIPNRLGYSINSNHYLNFNLEQIKHVVEVFKSHGINCIIIDHNLGVFNGFAFLRFKLNNFLFLLKNAKFIMSDEIDFLNLGLFYSSAAVICNHHTNNNDIRRVAEYTSQSHPLLSQKNLSVSDIDGFLDAIL